jgi:hypothetical protein
MSWRWLNEYITAAGITEDDSKGPLFRAAAGKRKRLTSAGYSAHSMRQMMSGGFRMRGSLTSQLPRHRPA